MAELGDLPNELLTEIATCLVGDYPALHNMCASSRLLCAIAQPLLYSSVQTQLLSRNKAALLGSLQTFHRSVSQRPDLAKQVKTVSLLEASPIQGKVAALERAGRSVSPNILRISRQSTDLAMAILHLLPNVKRISLVAQFQHPAGLLQNIHRDMRNDPSFLPKLETFHLLKEYEEGPVNFQDYIPFFEHSAFQGVTTETKVRTNQTLAEYPPENDLERSLMGFTWTLLDLNTLDVLLRTCTSLTDFTYLIPSSMWYDTQMDVGPSTLFPEQLITTLLKHCGNTLQALRVDFFHTLDFRRRDGEFQRMLQHAVSHGQFDRLRYPSFRGFQTLESLTIEFEKLRGLADLPASLVQLHLERCYFEDVSESFLRDLLRLKATWCPHIQHVYMDALKESSSIAPFLSLAATLGIRFSYSWVGRCYILDSSMDAGYALEVMTREAYPLEGDQCPDRSGTAQGH